MNARSQRSTNRRMPGWLSAGFAFAVALGAGLAPAQAQLAAQRVIPGAAQQPTKAPAPATPRTQRGASLVGVFPATRFDGDLRKLPPAAQWHPGDPIKFIPRRLRETLPEDLAPANPVTLKRDPLLARQEAAGGAQRAFTSPLFNFGGQGFTGVIPPDTVGAVGMNYYIQMVNSGGGTSFVFYDKTTGSVAGGPVTLDSLGSGNCANGLGDPMVVYDEQADRWVLQEFSTFGNKMCIYVSQVSGNPITGGWFNYEIAAPDFPDYPKLGVWTDAYYFGTNEFPNPAIYAIERAPMLSGAATSMQRSTVDALVGFGFQVLQPVDLDGDLAPPAGTPGMFVRHRDDERHNAGSNDPSSDFIEVWEYDVDFATPANTTLTGPFNISMSDFDSSLCLFSGLSCFDQIGGADLDPLREVIMFPATYRNFGSHASLVANMVVDAAANDQGAVRWFELRNTGSGWSTFNEGTYAPDSHNRWMASVGIDQSGNMALAYSISSSSLNPGIRYTGRLASDPAGAMTQTETTVANGLGASSANRWGDYSAMSLDPIDECTFWNTNEFTNNTGNWNTQITAFRFDACGTTGENCGDGLPNIGEACDDGNTNDGDGCSSSCQVEDGFVCTDAIGPGAGGNIVDDGSLELGGLLTTGGPNPFWEEFGDLELGPGFFFTPICNPDACTGGPNLAQDGTHWAWYGGLVGPQTQWLEQTVTIPSGALELTFQLDVQGNGGMCATPGDKLSVSIDGTEVWNSDPCTPTFAYNLQTVDLASAAGGPYNDGNTHDIRITGENLSGSDFTNFFVDSVAMSDPGSPGMPSMCTEIPENCSIPNLAIPDADPIGTTDSIVVDSTLALTDLDVSIKTTHTWVGDLVYTLTHVESGTSVVLIEQPGLPVIDPTFGCGNDNIDVVLDDDAGTSVHDQCSPVPPAIGGTHAPENPLAAFNGEIFEGTWTLAIQDLAFPDPGVLDEWCLIGTTDSGVDTDGDGVPDDADNCTTWFNPDQTDTNGDGFGNACDADTNNDCAVNFVDLGEFKAVFSGAYDSDYDFTGTTEGELDGFVNFIDLGRMKATFFNQGGNAGPGPSGTTPVCVPE